MLAGKAGPPVLYRHHACGEISPVDLRCAHCAEPMHASDVELLPGPGATHRTADDFAAAACCRSYRTTAHARNVVAGQAGASVSCMEAANASGPCSAAAGSIHMTCQPWPSRSKKLREYMKP